MKIKIKNDWRLNALVDEKKYTSMYQDSLNNNDSFWNKQGGRLYWKKKYTKCQTYKLYNVKKIYQRRLCLPSSSQLTKKQQDFICKKLKDIF